MALLRIIGMTVIAIPVAIVLPFLKKDGDKNAPDVPPGGICH